MEYILAGLMMWVMMFVAMVSIILMFFPVIVAILVAWAIWSIVSSFF